MIRSGLLAVISLQFHLLLIPSDRMTAAGLLSYQKVFDKILARAGLVLIETSFSYVNVYKAEKRE